MIKLDIVIPVYNEDENIVRLLKALEDEIVCNFRVLICYDSETDTTLKYIKDNKIIKSEVLLIRNPRKGPNSAIIKGIDSSNAKIILVYMADDFENIKLINRMTNLIELGNDLVIPTRFMPGGKMIGAAKIKEFVTRIGSYLIYYLARIPFKDCTNAFKMFSSCISLLYFRCLNHRDTIPFFGANTIEINAMTDSTITTHGPVGMFGAI